MTTTPYASEAFLHQILGKAVGASASDVHLKVGQPPGARVHGDMVYFRAERLTPADTDAVARILLASRPSTLSNLPALRELDVAYEVPSLGRFRAHVYRQRGSLAVVMRSIPLAVPTFDALGIPHAARALADETSGLVLVAGAAGHGKSTTLAAMVGHINATYPRHVVTLEDPIELVHHDARASISQRELGTDTDDFPSGVRAALRQDPDVLMIGELRDAATLDAALEAAEAGLLVLSSVPVPDITRTVRRLVSLGASRERLSASLLGIVAQQLLPVPLGGGLMLAAEVLVVTDTVRAAIAQPEGSPPLRDLATKN
ncbi:type IV pilus twitching motility protein PilT [Polyangium aurulentum]|uniref:type IV pilus twitching motility protein PilT n=1 Tax=Polyangium aurulentum TaxID=2567896 RepID=UPI0010AE1620|nr:ATPase, T2SS/T4P/T4SS family [Polyangium aurulentum]UQA58072.1 Flp pilus assembly complex ATPase component TadA [Polyangium aurulentum]